jgi:hypothetical protein
MYAPPASPAHCIENPATPKTTGGIMPATSKVLKKADRECHSERSEESGSENTADARFLVVPMPFIGTPWNDRLPGFFKIPLGVQIG